MEELRREMDDLRRRLEADIAALREANESTRTTGSTREADQLDRIEAAVAAVRGETSELIRRVPADLGSSLAELKRAVLERLAEAAEAPTRSTGSGEKPNGPTRSAESIVRTLTPQERRVFRLCFQSGLVSYARIAEHLAISPGAAKNLVNRIFQSSDKRRLFVKRYRHGTAGVRVRPDLEQRILSGKPKVSSNKHASSKRGESTPQGQSQRPQNAGTAGL